jgi:hypothetical protein
LNICREGEIAEGLYHLFVRRGSWGGYLIIVLTLALTASAAAQDIPATPIPEDPNDRAEVPDTHGTPATPRPIRSFTVPQHPFMAPNDDNNIHHDAYMTDAYERSGPLGQQTKDASTYHNAECASITFDKAGRIVTICVGAEGPRLVLIDPDGLATKTALSLPPRSGGGTGTSPFNDFSGGGYFYLDHRYRAVIPTNNRQIWVVGKEKAPSGFVFEVKRIYDLTAVALPGEAIVSVLPDWSGRLWFATTRGLVGAVGRRSGTVETHRLEGEVIANSFAVDEDGGVYIVSDHALYRFEATRRGAPKITWRQRYDRGNRSKPGQASQGSGATPTLIGDRYVAITDNADPRMHVIVYRRGSNISARNRLVCKEAVFPRRKGATDQSLIAVGHSLVVENNYGYTGPTATMDGRSTTPGIARVAFSQKGCRTVWESDEIAPSVVPKVSLATGLVYTYTKEPRDDGIDAWYLTAIDFRTGETVFEKLAGTGLGFNNNYAPVTLGRDGKTAYVGALGGLVQLRDDS